MDITNILNQRNSAAAAAAEAQLKQGLAQSVGINPQTTSEMGSHPGTSSQPAEPPMYPSGPAQPLHQIANMANEMRYPSPSQTPHAMPMLPNGYSQEGFPENGYVQNGGTPSGRSNGDPAVKSFACGTCDKGFARRSDLARHGKSTLIISLLPDR